MKTRDLSCMYCGKAFTVPIKKGTIPGYCSKRCKIKMKNERERQRRKNSKNEENIKINPYFLRRGNISLTRGLSHFDEI